MILGIDYSFLSGGISWSDSNPSASFGKRFNEIPISMHLNTPKELNLTLEYDTPLKVPQNFAGVAKKTTQVNSNLNIQNLSAEFTATVFISPNPDSNTNGIYHIPANDPQPLRFIHNWNGSQLKIANISSEAATVLVTLF